MVYTIDSETVEKIQNEFDLTDTTIYLWTIPSRLPIFIKNFKKDGIVKGFWSYLKLAFEWILPPIASMVILLLISVWFPKVALGLAILVCLISVYMWFLYKTKSKKVNNISEDTYQDLQTVKQKILSIGTYFSVIIFYHIAFFFSSGALAYIISSETLPIHGNFNGDIESKMSWLFFYLETYLNVITFDSIEILGLDISNIEPRNIYSRISTLFLKLFITIGIIDFILSIYNHIVKEKQFQGTPLEAYIYLHNYYLALMPFEMKVNGLNGKHLSLTEFRMIEYAYALDPIGSIKSAIDSE